MSKKKNDALGSRMKEYYEQIPKIKLTRRIPVILRIDGKAFHTFTRGFDKPFDRVLMKSMQQTMKSLCKEIQGCVFGYTQSDEITLLLVDYQSLNASAWFDYEVQKMCSIGASMATLYFNKHFSDNVKAFIETEGSGEKAHLVKVYKNALNKGALFDCRCFNIPKEEVTNCIYWRQQDATRNSIQMVGHANFSQDRLNGKSCNEIQDMLHEEKGINWNDFPIDCKRGSACYKVTINDRSAWLIDGNMPILKTTPECDYRQYVEQWINFEES